MTSTYEDRSIVLAWGLSLAVHAVVIGLAVILVVQAKPVLKDDVWHWEVALVDAISPKPAFEQPLSPPNPAPSITPAPSAAPPEPPVESIVPRVASQQSVQVLHPAVEPVKPVEQKIDAVEQPIETPPPLMEPTPSVHEAEIEPMPVTATEPVATQGETIASSPSVATEAETRATQQHETHHAASGAPPEALPQHYVAEASESPKAAESVPAPLASDSQPAPLHAAKVVPYGPEAKADHRWLAESLWRRVAELKRYPSFARLNGLEGKVVLRAIIRSDGHLAEVTVQKSSGHNVLDAAAMETVRLACPLHMKHAIGKPEIVVSLPIVYSLAN